ncbi:winged helix-turn-helix domain-containing protein [Halorussus gelatinilyticus]|uniref:Winged helix-turn-helix domain-containing protein n=1 Tax=Halorussus gelatinilyticus TaxID=2937524 RepID=A0A8U0IM22_9EURY|nr:winged helix-turn-helix domain-containing protein [Halorussus gelatinilyticus]UPW01661.1 winged helix-turn-helix domain-containing protein [Halorussus gelatinilyticus]
MADLLPSTSDATAPQSAEPRVIGVDSDDAEELLGALSSGTARELLAALHEDPATPSDLAETIDTSLQNAQYHLKKLENADVIQVVDTVYSEKGREMKVYAPADQPLVVFAGDEEKTTGLKSALSRLLGAFGALGLLSVAIQEFYGDGVGALLGGTGGDAMSETGGGGGGGMTVQSTDTAGQAADAAANALPPGLVFFAGGALVLALGFAWWYYSNSGE